jgi:hypothetical protein
MRNHDTGLDTLALERTVLHRADRQLRTDFAKRLITLALDDRGLIVPDQDSSAYKLLVERVARSEIPLTGNRASGAIVRELEWIRDTGLIRSRVEQYALVNEIDPRRMTDRVKDAMVAYLRDLGVQLDDDQRFADGGYDEYLAIAYSQASRTAGGSADPIVAARMKSGTEPWDFRVRFYDDVESAAVVPDYIRVAGALDYAFHIGEALGAFRLADHVVQLWDAGVLDVEDQDTIDRLFNYSENALQRGTPESRALVFKRVLNLGKATTSRGIVVNEDFPRLWHRLMAEAAKYLDRRQSDHGEFLSTRAIAHAIRDVQFNLTEHAGGGTSRAAQKINAHLEDAMDILSSREVIEQLSMGSRKSVWRVFQALHKDLGGPAVNVLALRTLAEEGNRIFDFVAGYTSSTPEDEFEGFLESAEAWILAEAALMERGEEVTASGEDGEPAEDILDEEMVDEELEESAAPADDWD